jgi:stage V sporulation protein R
MKQKDLSRLIKIEEHINRIAKEEMGLSYPDIHYDIVDDKKLLEIMAYIIPTNFSHWTFGRDYDKLRTIHENIMPSLPLEVVINSTPPRAFLSNANTTGIHILVMSHVVGHVHHFTNSKYYQYQHNDIVGYLSSASERFKNYEKKYGIDEVEPIIDGGIALQFHSVPHDNETDDEKRKRMYEQYRKESVVKTTEFSSFFTNDSKIKEDIESHNSKLWIRLKNLIPPEPTEDILRFIIDNSPILDSWQRDILEVNRELGRYFYANIKCKLLSEGFATFVHEKIIKRLYQLNIINNEEYSQFIYSNSLVKHHNPFMPNPYYVGCGILHDIEDRWNKGRHGSDWERCESQTERDNWDTKEGKGWNKILEIITSYSDWNLLQDFLTNKIVHDLDLYIYEEYHTIDEVQYRRTKHTSEEIKQLITMNYAFSFVPKISIFSGKDVLMLRHHYNSLELDKRYAEETMKHIKRLWGNNVSLDTVINDEAIRLII